MAAEVGTVRVVEGAQARAFLADQTVDHLPLDLEAARRLELLGIRTLGQLAAIPGRELTTQLGPAGRFWHGLAQGKDTRPVMAATAQPGYQLCRVCEAPVEDLMIIDRLVGLMAAETAAWLQGQGLACLRLALRLRLADRRLVETGLTLRRPASEALRLGRILEAMVRRRPIEAGVVEIEVEVVEVVTAPARQLRLFGPASVERDGWDEALADLVARYGAGCFYRVALLDPAARQVGRRFQLWEARVP
jgi:nucleotidyltransferase/DNA polymerase involved in DNA repair